ncbi:MAG: hypothetical protein HKN85_07075, partial [Gammaproteobacteria bacterium]|nr:hypothetical protein [Gammaproteobacteria bacterium]
MKINSSKPIKTLFFSFALLILSPGNPLYAEPAATEYSIVFSQREAGKRSIYLSDEDGKSRIKVIGITGNDGYPSVSPDGERIAFYGKYDDKKTWSIHTVNIDGTNVQRLTHEKNVWDSAPSWSPDGKTIAFAREHDDPQHGWQEEIWLIRDDGSEQRQIEELEGRAPFFLQDGRILYHSKTGPSQIFIANTDGSDRVQLTDNDANDWSPK